MGTIDFGVNRCILKVTRVENLYFLFAPMLKAYELILKGLFHNIIVSRGKDLIKAM